MDNGTFELFRDRFDRIEKQNDDQLSLMRAHIEKDDKAHKIVDRHQTYWSIVIWFTGILIVAAVGAAAAGVFK